MGEEHLDIKLIHRKRHGSCQDDIHVNCQNVIIVVTTLASNVTNGVRRQSRVRLPFE